MEAKLIKTKVGYHLWLNPETKEQEHIASDCEIVSDNGADLRKYKLSLKNCQEIENGYDLYDLAKTSMNKINILFNHSLDSKSHTIGFRAGWQHALKFFGNKKYSEKDLDTVWNRSADYRHNPTHENSFEECVRSLQQTKWDVEIVMEGFVDDEGIYCGEKPILDADGCLILKRKI